MKTVNVPELPMSAPSSELHQKVLASGAVVITYHEKPAILALRVPESARNDKRALFDLIQDALRMIAE